MLRWLCLFCLLPTLAMADTSIWCQKRPDGQILTTQEALPAGVQYYKVMKFQPNGVVDEDGWKDGACTIQVLNRPPSGRR